MRLLATPQACGALFAEAIAPFGFDTFASGEVDLAFRERSVFHIIGWPDAWRDFYFRSGLIEHDPVLDEIALAREAFTWSDLRASRKLSKLGAEALDITAKAGWIEGLIVPLPQASGRIGLVSLAGHRNCTDPAERGFLSLICICLHSHARSLIGRHGFAVPPAGLSAREIEAIRLVARGEADAGIASSLGIAVSTAHEHVEKAKRKLKVHSRAELAAIATSLGIVDI